MKNKKNFILKKKITPEISAPSARIECKLSPIPPADFEIKAQRFQVSHIPSKESSHIVNKKQEDNCGRRVPALKRVGVA